MEEKPVKLTAKLPKGKANGLESVHDILSEEFGSAYVIMEVRHKSLTTYPGGVTEPVVIIDRVEGLPGNLAREAAGLMNRARAARADIEKVHAGEPSERLPLILVRTDRETDAPYEPGTGRGAGWND